MERRYRNDPEFHTLVEAFYQEMYNLRFTYSELKNAVQFAALQIAQGIPR
jgi:hypothetical protein